MKTIFSGFTITCGNCGEEATIEHHAGELTIECRVCTNEEMEILDVSEPEKINLMDEVEEILGKVDKIEDEIHEGERYPDSVSFRAVLGYLEVIREQCKQIYSRIEDE